jgi:head-tail adaptor
LKKEEEKVSYNDVKTGLAKAVLREELKREPTDKEIKNWVDAERPSAKIGKISSSEVSRVEELLRR